MSTKADHIKTFTNNCMVLRGNSSTSSDLQTDSNTVPTVSISFFYNINSPTSSPHT